MRSTQFTRSCIRTLPTCSRTLNHTTQRFSSTTSPTASSSPEAGSTASGTGYAIAYCTCPTAEVVEKLSATLLERKLVACISSWPVTSQFVWQGKVEKESEHLMMIKTRADNVAALTRVIKENHPYEVPEVISADIQQGYPPYLKWLADVTEKAE